MNHQFLSWAVVAADLAVKATIVIAAAWIAVRLAKRAPAAARHMIWMAGLTTILLLPGLEAVAPRLTLFTIPDEAPPARVIDTVPVMVDVPAPAIVVDDADLAVTAAQPQPAPARPVNLVLWAEGAWAGGCAVVLLTTMAGWIALNRIKARVLPLPSGVTPSGSRPISLKISREGRPPSALTWGALRPTILLPRASEGWPADRLETVLLHELEHIRRWDAAKQLVGVAACAVYWFNPFVWLAAKAARSEAEAATDDAVLRHGVRPSAYAHTLMEVAAEIGRGHRLLSPTGVAFMKKSKIEARLRAILDGRTRRGITRSERAVAMSVAIGLLIPLAFVKAAAIAPFAALPQSDSEPTVTVKVKPQPKAQKKLTKKQLAAQTAHHERALALQARAVAEKKALATLRAVDSDEWLGLTQEQLKQLRDAGQLEQAKAAAKVTKDAFNSADAVTIQSGTVLGQAEIQPQGALNVTLANFAKADTIALSQDALKSADLAVKIADEIQVNALQAASKAYEVKPDAVKYWVTKKGGPNPFWTVQSGRHPTVSWQSNLFAPDARKQKALVYRVDPKTLNVFVKPEGGNEFRLTPGTVVTKKLLAEHSIYGVTPDPLRVLIQGDPTSPQQRKEIEEQRLKALEQAQTEIARAQEELRRAMELARTSQDPNAQRKVGEEKRAIAMLEAQQQALEAQKRARRDSTRSLYRLRGAQREMIRPRSLAGRPQGGNVDAQIAATRARLQALEKMKADRDVLRAQQSKMLAERRAMLAKREADRAALAKVRSELRAETLRRSNDPQARRSRLERERDALKARLKAIEDELNKGAKK